MIEDVLLSLHREEILRIARVGAQPLRHLVRAPEQVGEDAAVCANHRVGFVPDVIGYVAVVGVHRHLHAVSHVVDVDPLHRVDERVGIGVVVGRRVGVLNPEEPPVRRHYVRVFVERQERRDGLDALLNRPPILQQALGRYLAANQQVDVPELPCVSEAAQEGRHADAALAGVARPNQVSLLGLVVQLFRIGIRHHVIDGVFAVVDARVFHDQIGRRAFVLRPYGNRAVDGDVFGEEFGPSLRRELRDRTHGDADAVRIDQFLVHPRLRLRVEALLRHFARREKHLAIFAVYRVAVDVGVLEVVVRPDHLNLAIDVGQRPVVPQANVVYRLQVVLDELGVHLSLLGGVELLVNLVQPERLAGELDVARDERRFPVLLARGDDELLGKGGPGGAENDAENQPQRHRADYHAGLAYV